MAIKARDYDFGLRNGATLDDVKLSDIGDILDENGNEILEFDTVASAVNYSRVANAATSGNPTLSAQGDDTNISLQLSSKGTGLVLVGDTSTGTIVSGSATVNAQRGVLTTASLTTGSASVTVFDLLNNKISATSQVFASLYNGTNTAGQPYIQSVTVATAGSASIAVGNADPGPNKLNGTLKVNFLVLS